MKLLNRGSVALAQGSLEKRVFILLSAIIGLSFGLYLFFVSLATFSVVERNNLDKQNSILSSAVSELELAYLAESKKINLPLAYSLGFKDAIGAVFATRASPALSLAKTE